MLSVEEMANKLNGREYKQEMTSEEIIEAKDAGLVVVFGFSDDTTVIHGAIETTINTQDGAEIFLTKDGIFEPCPCDCIHSRRAKEQASIIKAIWCKGAYVWHYETDIAHATFEVIDNQPADNLKFCKGIVFKLSDVLI